MQTQSIQSQQPNKPQPSKSAPLPNNDFQQALTLEIERAPISTAPEQATAAPAQNKPTQQTGAKPPVKNTQQAKPAEPDQAPQTETAATTAEGKPVAAETPAQPADAASELDDDAIPVADPAADMLAMLAYGQMAAAKVDARPDPATGSATDATGGTDAAALAALQADGTGKGATLADLAADLAADKRAGKADRTDALQDAVSDKAPAGQFKLEPDAALSTDQKAEAFAARLADAAPATLQVAPPAGQALAATVQAANAVAANQLQARVGSNAWDQQLGQKVVWMVAGGDQSASLTLNPPDLGPLQVVLSVSNDSATATFTAHQPETRQAIENALPKLREMMNEAGIQLGNATVSAGSQEQQQAFAERARGGGGGGRGGNGGDGGDGSQGDEAQPVIRRTVLGAVDTFA